MNIQKVSVKHPCDLDPDLEHNLGNGPVGDHCVPISNLNNTVGEALLQLEEGDRWTENGCLAKA